MANCIVCHQQHEVTSSSAFTRMPCCKNTVYTDCLTYYCLSNHRKGRAKCPHCSNKFIVNRVLHSQQAEGDGEADDKDRSPRQLTDMPAKVGLFGQPEPALKASMSEDQIDSVVHAKVDRKPVAATSSGPTRPPKPRSADDEETGFLIPCETHPDEIYIMYCMACSEPLCVECLPEHTAHLPVDVNSANHELAATVHQLFVTVADNNDVISQRTKDNIEELASLSLHEHFLHGQQIQQTQKHVQADIHKRGTPKLFGAAAPKARSLFANGAPVPKPNELGAAAPELPANLEFFALNESDSEGEGEAAGIDRRWVTLMGDLNKAQEIERRRTVQAVRQRSAKNQMEIVYDQRKVIKVDHLTTVKLPRDLQDDVEIVALASLGDELYLLNAAGREVLVLTFEMHLLRRLGSDNLGLPSGLAVMPSKEHVAVADGPEGVKVLHLKTGQLFKTIGQDQLGTADDVAVTPGGKVIVADVRRCKVVVFDVQGDVILELDKEPCGRGQFNHPAHVAYSVLDEGRIVVRDTAARRVKVLSIIDGRCRYFYTGGRGQQAGILSASPGGVCVDAKGHVLIIDPKFRNVHIFSVSTGEYLGRMCLQNSFQRDPGPTMVTVTEAGFLLVASRDGNCALFILELD